MTTIVYRAGVLAADTLLTMGHTKLPERARKVFRLRDGRLFGSSGDSEGGLVLLDSLKSGAPAPKARGVTALLIETDGTILCWEGRRWSKVSGVEFIAIGHGSVFALGALVHGATAREAVRVGIVLDTHSGGVVQSVRLQKRKTRKR